MLKRRENKKQIKTKIRSKNPENKNKNKENKIEESELGIQTTLYSII